MSREIQQVAADDGIVGFQLDLEIEIREPNVRCVSRGVGGDITLRVYYTCICISIHVQQSCVD